MKNAYNRLSNAISVLGIWGVLRLCIVKSKIAYLKKNENKSYSQLYEDYFLDKFLRFKQKGFYIDVGANDPNDLSNTKRFYQKGWRGVNIEPNILNYNQLVNLRSEDININVGVSEERGNLDFYEFVWDEISTFSKEEAEKRMSAGNKLKKITKVDVDRLSNVLKKYITPGSEIDFLSVDTEGFDLAVLKSNDWSLFRPKLICIEVIEFGSSAVNKNKPVENFLNSIGYREVFFNGINSIYADKRKYTK